MDFFKTSAFAGFPHIFEGQEILITTGAITLGVKARPSTGGYPALLSKSALSVQYHPLC
jgi:hypothetical protein